jgi:biopolymer transport protein ExbD
MHGGRGGGTGKRRARIEVVPLIDIIFFLLATFVFLVMAMVRNVGVDVTLPGSARTAAEATKEELNAILIYENGDVYYNKEKIDPETMKGKLAALKKKYPDPTIIFYAANAVDYGRAVQVLDIIRSCGVKKVAFNNNPPVMPK